MSDFLCLSVCSLPHILTGNRLSVISLILDELPFSNFLDIFRGCLYISLKYFWISYMLVSWFIASLPYWYYINSGYLQFWTSYLSQIFWRHSWDVCTIIPTIFKFLVCLSACSLPHILTKIMLTVDISSSGWASFLKFSADIPGIPLH